MPDLSERVAKVETSLDWIKVLLALIGTFMIGGFTFMGVQFNRLDTKVDALSARITEEGARTRQELIGITAAIANSITATRQVQPQILIMPPVQQTPEQPKP